MALQPALRYASEELQKDREVVNVAVDQDASALQYASKEPHGDLDLREKRANCRPGWCYVN